MSNKIKLPQGAWFKEEEITITFPSDWQLKRSVAFLRSFIALIMFLSHNE